VLFLAGRRLGHSGLGRIHWLHFTPDRMKWPERLFKRHGDKTVFNCAIHLFVSACRDQFAGRHVNNALARFSVLQPHGVGGLRHHLHADRILFWKEMETARSLVGSHRTLSDFRGDCSHCSGRDFQAFCFRVFTASFLQRTQAKIMDGHDNPKEKLIGFPFRICMYSDGPPATVLRCQTFHI